MARGSRGQKVTGLSPGGSSWALGSAGKQALSQEALSSRVTPAAGEGRGAFKIQLCLQESSFCLDSEGGRRSEPPPCCTARALRAHLITPWPLPACRGMLIDTEPLFGLFNSFSRQRLENQHKGQVLGSVAQAGGKAGLRRRHGWGAHDLCPQCPLGHQMPHTASASPSLGRKPQPLSLCSHKKQEGFDKVPDPTSSHFSFYPSFFDDFGPDSPTPSTAVPKLHRTSCDGPHPRLLWER